jgi:hypothetical protein
MPVLKAVRPRPALRLRLDRLSGLALPPRGRRGAARLGHGLGITHDARNLRIGTWLGISGLDRLALGRPGEQRAIDRGIVARHRIDRPGAIEAAGRRRRRTLRRLIFLRLDLAPIGAGGTARNQIGVGGAFLVLEIGGVDVADRRAAQRDSTRDPGDRQHSQPRQNRHPRHRHLRKHERACRPSRQ